LGKKRDTAGERAGGGRAARPERKPFLLRLSPELMDELRAWAGHEFRSLNGQIEFLLRQAVRRRKNGKDGP
jgi:hypothetical protein